MNEQLSLCSGADAGIIARSPLIEVITAPVFTYNLECIDRDGHVRWTESMHNLVTTAGKNDLLDKYFAASAYTPTWYLGLISALGTGVAAGDTLASKSWTETVAGTVYTGTRKTLTWNAASAGSKAANAASFAIIASDTINGCFSATVASGTAGILYSAGTFTARSVLSGDTLNVTLTVSV